ncbi:MAG TPA: Hcp family type VI secretion system effector [Myxococcota bacterium]|nr:Hcp family type VI secretion system effector [Myxococcota bacterium]
MPNPIYVWFKGANQGDIGGHGSWPGEDDQKGREKSSIVYEFDYQVEIPFDVDTGQASGRRRHKPIVFTKRIDKASPQLHQACTSGETLTKVKFEFYRVDPMGGQEKYYTIELDNAKIVNIEQWFPITHDKETAHYPHLEEVQLTFQKITYTWVKGGVTSTDDWQAG